MFDRAERYAKQLLEGYSDAFPGARNLAQAFLASEAARGRLSNALEKVMLVPEGAYSVASEALDYETTLAALAEPKDGAMQALADQAQALDMGYEPRKEES
jgi:hypothetical protein